MQVMPAYIVDSINRIEHARPDLRRRAPRPYVVDKNTDTECAIEFHDLFEEALSLIDKGEVEACL